MAYKNLQDFITALESMGELKRINAEVSPELEITEIADRMSKMDDSIKAMVDKRWKEYGF